MSDKRLGRDVFLALAAIGWADGHLDPEEADAIVKTALEEGLEIEEIEQIEQATKEPVELGSIDISGMSKADRLFVYAVASWMTRLDGKTTEDEVAALDQLGATLKIPEKPRAHADAIAREIAALEANDKTLEYDLTKLRKTIGDRLEEARRMRLEQAAAGEDPES